MYACATQGCCILMHVCWHCSRATGDAGSAITYYEESVEFLSKVPVKDLEVFFFFFINRLPSFDSECFELVLLCC